MAASTTVKVATQSGAAKDDSFLSSVTEDMLTAKLAVLANDPGAAKLYSLVPLTGLAPTTQVPVVSHGITTRGALVSLNADGTIGYDASGIAASLQSLAAGQTATDTFEYIARMANGALSTAKVTVSIGGLNDAPTLHSMAAAVINDTALDDTPAAIEGVLAGSDIDNGAVLTYGLVSGSSAYGTLTLGSNGQYSFNADADQIDALAAGVNASATFVVNVSDEHGATSAPVTLQFDLIGANDTATISGDGAGAVTEDGAGNAAGLLTVSDRDSGESVFAVPNTLAGTFGDFSFDAAGGAWAYALRNDAANVQALNAGQTAFDTMTVASLDGSAAQMITVAIHGAAEALPPAPPADPVDVFMITYGGGKTSVHMNNGKLDSNLITGFDANDVLRYAANLTAVVEVVNNDTVIHFDHNGNTFDITLVGISNVGSGQIVATNG